MKNWDIERRDVLKGLGIGAACLPLLRSSKAWADAGGSKEATLFILHATAGYWMANWRPRDGALDGQTLPSSTAPLEPHKKDIAFLHPLANPAYTVGANWGHECYGTIYWGGPQRSPGGKYQEPMGMSLDQIVGEGFKAQQGFQGRVSVNFQVQVDIQPRSGTAGSIRCFWRGLGQPVNPEANPSKTYASLFAGMAPSPAPTPDGQNMGGAPDPAVTKLLGQRKSILDYVGKSLERFKAKVGTEDKAVIGSHLESIRTLEQQLSGMGNPGGGGGGPRGPVTAMKPENFDDAAINSQPALFPKILDSYIDMAIAAMASGVTRVATIQLANGSGNQLNFGSFVEGIPARGTGYKSAFRNWHDLGHNPTLGGQNHKIIVDKWCMEKYASIITRLKGVQQQSGSMFDNGIVLWGNHMESGDNHQSQRQAWVLAGKAGGKFKGNQMTGTGKNISNALADIAKLMGVTTGIPPHWTGTTGIV